MLRRYPTHIESDLQRYYGIHLGLIGTRALTLRRLSVLLAHLPDDSATVSAMREDTAKRYSDEMVPSSDWPLTDQLLGGILDAVRAANWQRGGGKGRRPESVMGGVKRHRPQTIHPDAREILRRAARGDG